MASRRRRVVVGGGVVVLVAVSGLVLIKSLSEKERQAPNALTLDPITGSPSFARLPAPAGLDVSNDDAATRSALEVLAGQRDELHIADPRESLKLVETRVDGLGVRHVKFAQHHRGLPVYGGEVAVHFPKRQKESVFIGNHFVPGIALASIDPGVQPEQAVETARRRLSEPEQVGTPTLSIYPGKGAEISGKSARLAWLVELRGTKPPAWNVYVVDARDGSLFDVIPRQADVLDRSVYDLRSSTKEPVRSEGGAKTGDSEVDNVYDYLGETHAYYEKNWKRDSYDAQGAPLQAGVHDGDLNAYWSQGSLIFGEGFAVKDVAAHELTHAVTEKTAGLEYFWQSGALNESFSDVFGVMVDRDNWTLGEELPPEVLRKFGKSGALRDMADPTRQKQPAHVKSWVNPTDCRPENRNGDQAGVHSNSGIPNKAFYNVAEALGKEAAEQIFYYTLLSLQKNSGFEDLRSTAISVAGELPDATGREAQAVEGAFDAVGIDGSWQPPTPNCTRTTGFVQ